MHSFVSLQIDTDVLADFHAFTVVPTALGTALDVNLSNASLVFISVTFATMVCSYSFDQHTTILFLFEFARQEFSLS